MSVLVLQVASSHSFLWLSNFQFVYMYHVFFIPSSADGHLGCFCVLVVVLASQSCPTLCNPMDCVACQAPLSLGFSRQEYWSGLPFPFPEDLPNPGIEPWSPALQENSLPFELQKRPFELQGRPMSSKSWLL